MLRVNHHKISFQHRALITPLESSDVVVCKVEVLQEYRHSFGRMSCLTSILTHTW